MSDEYIKREKLERELNAQYAAGHIDAGTVIDILSNLPTAPVREVVRGRWDEDEYGFTHCSICGMEWDEPEHPATNFCPNCGADMGVKEGETT